MELVLLRQQLTTSTSVLPQCTVPSHPRMQPSGKIYVPRSTAPELTKILCLAASQCNFKMLFDWQLKYTVLYKTILINGLVTIKLKIFFYLGTAKSSKSITTGWACQLKHYYVSGRHRGHDLTLSNLHKNYLKNRVYWAAYRRGCHWTGRI